MEELMHLDLYEIIGVVPTACTKEIKAAYRKKALTCHPDKNPDNPRAAELFLRLSKILEILTDDAARAAYDKVIHARQQAKLRTKELDSKRRKFKEDLEAREQAFNQSQNDDYNTTSNERQLKAEIERLKKEGSRQVEEEIRYVQQQIIEQLLKRQGNTVNKDLSYTVKLKWKVQKDDANNGGYNYDILYRMLLKYGEIEALMISSKKGRGLVEFKTKEAAESAVQIEIGLQNNPLKMESLWKPKNTSNLTRNTTSNTCQAGLFPSAAAPNNFSFSSAPDIFANQQKMSDAEFETSVLSNLRRAEERKRLIEKMKAEEEGT